MSHTKCIELAIKHNYPHIFICEDDICFTDPASLLNSLTLFQNNISNNEWDVILVAGNNCPPYSRVGEYAIRVTNCQTATGYIVNNHYYTKLLSNFKEGVSQLVREPENKRNYACDMYWKRLQQTDRWFMITPPTVVQYADYSNIENKQVSYAHLMLDLDKKWLFEGHPPSHILQPQQTAAPTRPTIQMPLLYNINSTFSLI
jgi:glycosyl transferase family 25